jgi:hypothetical protein
MGETIGNTMRKTYNTKKTFKYAVVSRRMLYHSGLSLVIHKQTNWKWLALL